MFNEEFFAYLEVRINCSYDFPKSFRVSLCEDMSYLMSNYISYARALLS
jgi:hypothetical protein